MQGTNISSENKEHCTLETEVLDDRLTKQTAIASRSAPVQISLVGPPCRCCGASSMLQQCVTAPTAH